jgi:tetratricopeptide (TPR) repeat protein
MNTAHQLLRLAAALVPLTLFSLGCAAMQHGPTVLSRYPSHPPAASRSVPRPDEYASAQQYDERRDEMQFQLAEARWRRNDMAACQQSLEEIVARNPEHRGAHLRLAELCLLKNKPAKALPLLQRFCREHRDDAEAHHLLGLAFEALGKQEQSVAAYQRAVKLDPEEVLYRTSLETALAGRGKETAEVTTLDTTAVRKAAAEHKGGTSQQLDGERTPAFEVEDAEEPKADTQQPGKTVRTSYELETDEIEEPSPRPGVAAAEVTDQAPPLFEAPDQVADQTKDEETASGDAEGAAGSEGDPAERDPVVGTR